MGFESFQVKLSRSVIDYGTVVETVQRLENVTPDAESIRMRGCSYWIMKDGRHAIEMEVLEKTPRISIRFTLCHPPSVDAVFFELIKRLITELSMQVTICDDVSAEHEATYSLDHFDEFTQVASQCVAARRREWVLMFGDRQMGATTNEVHQHIILPQCRHVEKAG